MNTTQNRKPKAGPCKIVIVDDHPMVREHLSHLIGTQKDLVTCGEADSASTALDVIARTQPDLAIVDISLKHSSGIDLIKDIRKYNPQTRVLVLSMYEESLYAERALRAGARGYLTKQEATTRIIETIRLVLDGQICLSARMSGVLLKRFVDGESTSVDNLLSRLSDREFQIFQLIASGHANRHIANQLGLSPRTIETHRAHIKEKLALKDGAELLQYALHWSVRHSGT